MIDKSKVIDIVTSTIGNYRIDYQEFFKLPEDAEMYRAIMLKLGIILKDKILKEAEHDN